MTDEEHKRIVDAAVAKFRVVREATQGPKSQAEQVFERLGDMSIRVWGVASRVFAEERAKGHVNFGNIGSLVGTLYLDELKTWSKDDLLILAVTMNTHGLMFKVMNE